LNRAAQKQTGAPAMNAGTPEKPELPDSGLSAGQLAYQMPLLRERFCTFGIFFLLAIVFFPVFFFAMSFLSLRAASGIALLLPCRGLPRPASGHYERILPPPRANHKGGGGTSVDQFLLSASYS
jgi:hypothetical protein